MALRGIRGAITTADNSREAIMGAAARLTEEILAQNDLTTDNIGAAIFSATEDLTAAFPAAGARQVKGFDLVPLFDARQMAVVNGLERCIRALFLVDTDKSQREIQHIYMGEAKKLRPDLL